MGCILKYAILPSKEIINPCGPEHDPVGWTPETIKARKRKTQERFSRGPTKQFFIKLEESILKEGFRNPIIVTAGLFSNQYKRIDKLFSFVRYMKRIPTDRIHEAERLITCERVGGSRLYITQKHNMDIPCIVNDFIGLVDGEILRSREEVLNYFEDKPFSLRIESKGIMSSGLPHIHMEKENENPLCCFRLQKHC